MPTTTLVELGALGAWRDRWDELVLRQPLPSPFQRTWWLEAVAPDATCLLVHDGDRLLGGLAVAARTRGGVTLLTAPGPAVLCPDHLDLLTEADARDRVATAVGAWFGQPGQRLLDLRGAVASPVLSEAVGGSHREHDAAPYDVVEPGADWLATRSSNFRRSVRRSRKRLAALGFEPRRAEAGRTAASLEELRRLHESREGRGALMAELPRLTAAVAAGAERGEARVDVLASTDEVAAVVLSFVVAGRLSLYQVARSTAPDHDGAGTVLLAEVIQDAVGGGCHEVDLLRGAEGYKGSFADRRRPLERVRAAHGAWATTVLHGEDLARRAKEVSASVRSRGGTGS